MPDVDLGHDVRMEEGQDRLVLSSVSVDLGLHPPQGRVPGTAVDWHGRIWHVAEGGWREDGGTWILLPWPEGRVARRVMVLDERAVAEQAQKQARERRGESLRWRALPFLPLLGLAPESLQLRWRSEWGFPAVRATWLSALLQLFIGALGLVEAYVLGFAGDSVLPAGLEWLAFVGPLLFVEALVRMVLVAARDEPISSVEGLPLLWLPQVKPEPEGPRQPEILSWDPEAAILELAVPVRRPDWEQGGFLKYHDVRLRLENLRSMGTGFLYRFVREVDTTEARELRLRSPRPREDAPPPKADVSIPRFAVGTALMCFAPAEHQVVWTVRHRLPRTLLTWIGGSLELLGGMRAIGPDWALDTAWMVLDMVLLTEGVIRLAAAVRGRALGSVFGRPFGFLWKRLNRPS